MKRCTFAVLVAAFFMLFSACAPPLYSGARLLAIRGARYSLYLGEGRFFELPYPSFSCKTAIKVRFLRGDALSEEIRFSEPDCSVEEVLAQFRADVIKKEQIGDTAVWYCRGEDLFRTKKLPFGKVNMQIARTGDAVTVGFPVIYGGF